MKGEQTLKLLADMFGATSSELKKAEALIAAGHTVNSGLFNFYAQVNGQNFEYTSPVMLTKFTSQNALVKYMIQSKVSEVLNKATEFMKNTSPASGASTESTNPTEPIAHQSPAVADYFGADPAVTQTKPDKATSKPMPVDAVIKLSEARAVGQKVRGSSIGSVYRAIAIGPANVAFRLQSSSISVRVEFQKERDEVVVSKLVKMGFTDNTNYLSMHLKLDGAPPSRVLGAILYGMEMEFDQISTVLGAVND